jgi:nucleoside-diphosphate-sugar epimerase
MRILVTGAAGMLGRKLTESFVRLGGPDGGTVDALTLVDAVEPAAPQGFTGQLNARAADIAAPGVAEVMIADRPDLIFHLAAVVSGEAEADFDKGYRVNLDATRSLFEAIRHTNAASGYRPRLVFASSITVFGAPLPERIGDEFFLTPLTSYGTQKAIVELLLADYSRRGFFDGVGLRLPTVCVRPGKPNRAASGFFSSIIREPLIGEEAILPVGDDVRHWHASPRSAIGFLRHAATVDLAPLGARRNLTMPGVSATVADEIAALTRVAGPGAAALIRREPDPTIARIVSGWAGAFDAARALALGFRAETSFDAIVQAHIEDELGGRVRR